MIINLLIYFITTAMRTNLSVTRLLRHSTSQFQLGRMFEEGDKVEARYKGRSRFFPGRIARANRDGTYDVRYSDGKKELAVAQRMYSGEHLQGVRLEFSDGPVRRATRRPCRPLPGIAAAGCWTSPRLRWMLPLCRFD